MPHADPQEGREYRRKWMNANYWKHPRKARAYASKWARENRERIKRWKAPWTRKSRARARIAGKCWICTKRKKQTGYESCKPCRLKNRRRCMRWRHANNQRYLRTRRIYNRKNLELVKHWDASKRANRRKAKGSHTFAEWQAVCRKHRWRCAHCKKRKRLTRDHIIPLSRGGTNFISNIQPLCSGCNCKKGVSLEN